MKWEDPNRVLYDNSVDYNVAHFNPQFLYRIIVSIT